MNDPLARASDSRYLDRVHLLLQRRADADDSAALSIACSEGHLEVALLLLEYGACIKDYSLYEAVEEGHLEVAR